MSQENYSSRKNQLMRAFDKSLLRVKPQLRDWLGEAQADHLIEGSRKEHEDLIPRIPFIGRKNPLLIFLLPTSRYLAVYRALQDQGRRIEDAGQLTIMIASEDIRAIPAVARRLISYLWFSHWFKRRIKKRAIQSQIRTYPGDFVLNYIEGNSRDFDFGVDYIECANCKFLEAENATELLPYICAVDKTASELLGWGLIRTITLAEGSHKCDFRFTKGGQTFVSLPQHLQTYSTLQ